MTGNIDIVEFGKNKLPDKALFCFDSSDLVGMKDGHGLCIFALNNPGTIPWGGKHESEDQVGEPIIGLWFHREESLDTVIRTLQEIKKRFRNDADQLEDVSP